MKSFLLIVLLASFLAVTSLVDAADVTATTAISLPVDSVTIYPDGLVFVKRIGTMELTEGTHDFVVDVPSSASQDSILFLVSNSSLQRVVFDGLPTYSLNVLQSGVQDFMLSYLMYNSASWTPSYSLHLNDDTMVVSSKAIVKSDLGQDLKDVRLKLVAGPREQVTRNYLMYEFSDVAAEAAAPKEVSSYMPSTSGRTTGELETLFVFEVQNRTDLEMDKEIGLPLFEVEAPIKRIYTWDAYEDVEGPVMLEIRANNTGNLPWPGGDAMVYKDGDYVTMTDMAYTPIGSNASLEIGSSSDLKVSKSQTGYNITEEIKTVSDQSNVSHPFRITTENYTYKLEVKSTSDKPLYLEVTDTKPMKGEVTQVSPIPTKTSATTLKWELQVDPRAEMAIVYTYKMVDMEPVSSK